MLQLRRAQRLDFQWGLAIVGKHGMLEYRMLICAAPLAVHHGSSVAGTEWCRFRPQGSRYQRRR